eukprot:2437899-Rhodomonas_salina.1
MKARASEQTVEKRKKKKKSRDLSSREALDLGGGEGVGREVLPRTPPLDPPRPGARLGPRRPGTSTARVSTAQVQGWNGEFGRRVWGALYRPNGRMVWAGTLVAQDWRGRLNRGWDAGCR